MSRNYVHIRDGNNLIRDEEGIELPSLEAAHTEAILVTREAVRLATLRGERIGMHGGLRLQTRTSVSQDEGFPLGTPEPSRL